jgi:hypothetical protein
MLFSTRQYAVRMRTVKAPIIVTLVASLATGARAEPATGGVSVEDRSTVDIDGHVIDRWVPRDAHGLAIRPEQFYRDVGRPDLIEARARRHSLAIGALVGGIAFTGVGAYFIVKTASIEPATRLCDPSLLSFSQFAACGHANVEANAAAGRQGGINMLYAGGALLGGAVAFGISTYLFLHPEPVTQEEAELLAADANRRRLTSITPYAQPGGGGLVIAGRF